MRLMQEKMRLKKITGTQWNVIQVPLSVRQTRDFCDVLVLFYRSFGAGERTGLILQSAALRSEDHIRKVIRALHRRRNRLN